MGDTPASRQTLLDAARLAVQCADTARLVRAVLANSRLYASVMGTIDEELLEFIDIALDLVGPAATPERAELLALQAAELQFVDDHERRLRVADEAAAIAAGLDDVSVRARVGVRRFLPCVVPDRAVAMVSDGAELVNLSDATGDPHLRVWSRVLLGHALFLTGDLKRARSLAVETMTIANDAGQPGLRCLAHAFSSTALDALGEHAEAQRVTQAVPELGQLAGWPDALLWYIGTMFMHYLFTGQTDILAALGPEVLAEYPRLAILQLAWNPTVMAFRGDRDAELAEFLARVPSVVPALPLDFFWLTILLFFAFAMGFGVEDRGAAGAIYDRLLPYRLLHGAVGITLYEAPVEVALAITARVLDDPDAALAHHRAAAGVIDSSGAARPRALNGYQWARTLLARDAPGDRQRAADLLQETLKYSRTKGYTFLVEKCEELTELAK